MLTLITGTPGAGKSLYSVWELARKVPSSTIEINGEAHPRKLFSNVKNLLVDHEHIDGDALNNWHTWVKPGDVILFDEVQEVWRPRSVGSKVPDCIAALETHRHMGVDIILVTQHPQLLDANIRRLVNQHLHLRRVTKRMAMVYEWDHCSNISSMKTALQSRLWHHPKAAYSMYKSAQAHTKPTQRMPRVVWFGAVALAGAAFLIPNAIGRLSNSFGMGDKASSGKPASGVAVAASAPASAPVMVKTVAIQSPSVVASFVPPNQPEIRFSGCARSADQCRCLDVAGAVVEVDLGRCMDVSMAARGAPLDIGPDSVTPVAMVAPGDVDTLRWMAAQRGSK